MSVLEPAAVIVVSSLAISPLTGLIGIERNWPDFLHWDYGLPITWRRHVLSTIAGPIDKWEYDFLALAVDFFFWIVIVGSIIMALFLMSQRAPLSF